jgi:hypothetical protein
MYRGGDPTKYVSVDSLVGKHSISLGFNDLSASNPSSSAVDDFNARAYDAMYPDLEGEIDLTNSILELTDVKEIWRLFGKIPKRIRDIPTSVANAHLTYAFGIRPLVSDLRNLYSTIANYSETIDNFMRKRNTIQKRHYREKTETSSSPTIIDSYSKSGYTRTTTDEWSSNIDWYATMVYTYDCPDLETYSDHLKVLRDMLGLRFTLAEAWEAIPFSFVVDWFFRVEDFLQQFKQPLFKVDLTVIDYCITTKTNLVRKRHFWGDSGCRPGTPSRLTSRGYQTYYNRRVCLPNTGVSLSIKPGRFGPNQLALSASLLLVNLRR